LDRAVRILLAAVALGLAAAADEAWEEPDWQPAEGGRRAAMAGDFRLEESDPAGDCGEHDFSAYRDAGMPEFSYCARALKYRMRGRRPEFLVSGLRVGSKIGGPSGWVFEDVLVRYEKGRWSETVVMVIDYDDGKPRDLQKN
jgi:hypothetical protein